MDQKELRQMLEEVRNGEISVSEAVKAIRIEPFEDLGYAKVDHHRAIRQGTAEVIYGAGKTPPQIAGIVKSMLSGGQRRVLITRMSPEAADHVRRCLDPSYEENDKGKEYDLIKNGESVNSPRLDYDPVSRIGTIGDFPEPDGIGNVVVATGGTSDIPVAEEAAKTAEILGNRVIRLYDVGVSGIHRLMSHREEIMAAEVIVAVAGMEGALASVIGGLADCPVIAVPTSVGYGASFGGLSALLSMLNSCASGVSVVNIDNGFGAGYLANMINHRKC